MTIPKRISRRYYNAFLIPIIICLSGIYSCASAQGEETATYPKSRIKNGRQIIKLAPLEKTNMKAVAMNSTFNSPYSELKPVFSPNGKRLYFSRSFHPDNSFGERDQEDIWYANFDDKNDVWSDPIRMQGVLNNAGPNFIESVSLTGDTIILGNQYLKHGKMRNGVSYSVNVEGEWTAPRPIYIEDDYNISGQENHFVNLKNGIIISAVQRSESFGDRDLYVSFWNGEYATKPFNMGGVINTDREESSPYLAADNKTLYFASKGHTGFGGYDIFMTTRLDETWVNWSEPVNLGAAVNGPMDDQFFTITHCAKYAIFSKQVNIHNIDLYKISIKDLFGEPVIADRVITQRIAFDRL